MIGLLRVAISTLALAFSAEAQDTSAPAAWTTPAAPDRVRVPFGPGERADYQVKFGIFSVGRGSMDVIGIDTVRGHEAWHVLFRVRGGMPGYRVDDRMESWMDTRSLASLRFRQEMNEGSHERERSFEIYPDRQEYVEDQKPPAPSVAEPLDDGSFLYFVRTIPLEVGKEYVFERYFRPDRNPVRIQVLRKERVKVPAGTFETIVIRPIIKARGVFSENGRAEIWLTDDERRLMVQMKSHMKVGSLSLYLRSYTPPTVVNDSASRKPDSTQARRDSARRTDSASRKPDTTASRKPDTSQPRNPDSSTVRRPDSSRPRTPDTTQSRTTDTTRSPRQ